MRATRFIGAFTLAVAALSIPAMSTPLWIVDIPPQDPVTSTCNEGSPLEHLITCSDATAACLQVPNDVSISLPYGKAQQLTSVGSATVWLTRAIRSSTIGNATGLCLQMIGECCPGGTTMTKAEIPLPYANEQGSIQIVPSS